MNIKLIIFVLLMTLVNASYAYELGYLYEQEMNPNSGDINVSLFSTGNSVRDTGFVDITATVQCDSCVPDFYWEASGGVLQRLSSDYSKVRWYPTNVKDGTIHYIRCIAQNRKGKISTSYVRVVLTHSDITVEYIGNALVIKGSEIDSNTLVRLNNEKVNTTFSSGGYLSFNYDQNALLKSGYLEVINNAGSYLYLGCFPFKDVCSQQWYTKPIMKLWKDNVVEGYDEGKSGIFGTNNDANRAEFTTALVRSLEQGKTPSPLTADPFADVSKDKWYAPEVQYAKALGLIQGCDTTKNLFCPDKAITRAEASKVLVLAYPDLKQLAIDYQQGKAPSKVYSDVTDKQQWYYPYIYAVQAARIAQGYKDGTFQPNSALKRSEMAQMICIAKFGVMACTDMGDTATKALVLTVSPYKAQLNQSTVFTVLGLNLAETMSLTVQDCSNITRLSHAADKQTYQCTPTLIGSKTAKMTESTGKVLYSGTVQVEGVVVPVTLPGDTSTPPTNVVTPTTPPQNCTSSVSSIDPAVFVRLGEEITFTVTGSCLSDKTALYLDECASPNQGASSVPQIAGGTAERRQFRCTPGYKATTHSGVVKDDNDGRELLKFNIDYRWGTPKVDSVTPTTAKSKQPTVFTITGASLLDTTAAWIKTCTGLQMFAGNANTRTFQCTPTDTGSMSIIIKAEPDVKAPDGSVTTPGRELYNSTVTVQ